MTDKTPTLASARDVVDRLRALERQGEDYIWRTAEAARLEIERLRGLIDSRPAGDGVDHREIEARRLILAAFGEYACMIKAKLSEAEIAEFEKNFARDARAWLAYAKPKALAIPAPSVSAESDEALREIAQWATDLRQEAANFRNPNILSAASEDYLAMLDRRAAFLERCVSRMPSENSAHPSPQQEVPEGFVLVPVESTQAMLDYFAGTDFRHLPPGKQKAERESYRLMLASRPVTDGEKS